MSRSLSPILYRASVLLLLSLLIMLCPPQQLWGQVAKLYPVDEAAREPSFFVFRSRLLQALHEHDETFLLSVLSPDIKSSFGGDAGIEDFKSFWELGQPGTEVWKTLLTVLALGGSFQGDSYFVAPYTNSKFPSSLDAFEHGVILGEQVEARQKPEMGSPVIAILSFDIVSIADWTPVLAADSRRQWIAVQLAGGTQAFVPQDQIRSPIDYRAMFEKRDGNWLMTILVAGD